MSDTKISISLDIKNQAALNTLLDNLSKKYSLDLSLPLDQLISANSKLSSLSSLLGALNSQPPVLNNQLVSLSAQLGALNSLLSAYTALLPDLYYLNTLRDRLQSSINRPSSPLTASDDARFCSASNALSILSLAFDWASRQSLSSSSLLPPSALQMSLPDSSPNSQLGALNSLGYSPSGIYSSPLDSLFEALEQLHSFSAYISDQQDALSSSIISKYQNIVDDPYNSIPYPVLELRLDADLKESFASLNSSLLQKLSDIYQILSLWLPQYASLVPNLSNPAPFSPQTESHGSESAVLGSDVTSPSSDPSTFNSQLSTLNSFIASYNSEMAHLSQLRSLGLINYSDVVEKAWEYFRALQAIATADGEVSDAEKELLNLYRSRAQRAQLAQNRDGSDLTRYYNEVKAMDHSYYDWKKSRIEEEVKQMDITEEQKAALLKKRVGELDAEQHQDNQDHSLISYMFDDLGISESDQKGIVESYSILANQISGIWKQLYSNLDTARQDSLEKLEKRAKDERRTEAWLASEKAKINAEYDQKARQMKKAEKAMQIASASMNTAEAVTNALTLKPAWLAPIMAASVGALGLYQVSLIASQKLARGGLANPGLFRGKGTTTSDSNLIAISDNEYIVSASRVRDLGLPLLDALNFGDGEAIRKALASFNYNIGQSAIKQAYAAPNKSGGYSNGGAVVGTSSTRPITQKIVLVCDGRELARAVAKGNKRIVST